MLCDTSPTAVTPHPCVSEPILMRPLAPIGIAAGGSIDASDDCGVVRVDVDSHPTVSSALHGFVLPIPNVCVATGEELTTPRRAHELGRQNALKHGLILRHIDLRPLILQTQ